jgi:flagellin
MIITHNMPALRAMNYVKNNSRKSDLSMEKLSSGLRINKAADDSAGLAISEKMRAQIRGLEQAQRNIQDAVSLIQTADGGLSNILDPPLQRMRELAVQAANDTLTSADRGYIQSEINELKKEIDGIADQTLFNGKKLINGDNKITTNVVTTPEKIAWTEINTGSAINFYDVAWSGERFLAVGYQGNTLASADGTTWYVPSSPVTNVNLNSIKWDGNQFLVSEGGSIYTTTDGVNRTGYSASIPGINGYLFDADYIGGKYIAIGDDGKIATTADPTVNYSWTSISSGTTEQLLDVASSGNDYVIVGRNGTVLRSADAINWSLHNSGTGTLRQVIWGDGKYIASGSGGTIVTSTDGISWTKQNTPSGINVIQDIVYNGNEFVAVSNDGWILTSKDAENWEGERIQGNPYLQGIAWDGENYIAIGWQGKAYRGTRTPTVSQVVEQQSLKIQLGANSGNELSIELSDVRTDTLQIDNIDILTSESSNRAIVKIDNAIQKVSSERSKFGSYQNRLEHALKNASNYEVNLTAAESRIRDVNMAEEMMEHTKNSILSQAAQAMLAQSNQMPQGVLQLLR